MIAICAGLAACDGDRGSGPGQPAMLLSNGTIGGAFVTELEATGRDPLESFAVPDEKHKPRPRTPSIVVLIQSVRSSPESRLIDGEASEPEHGKRVVGELPPRHERHLVDFDVLRRDGGEAYGRDLARTAQ